MKNLALLFLFAFAFPACDPPEGKLAELSPEKQLIAYETLLQFKSELTELELLTLRWLHERGQSQDKLKLKKLVGQDALATRQMLKEINSARKDFGLPALDIDTMIAAQEVCLEEAREVMSTLQSVSDYEEPVKIFPLSEKVNDPGSAMRVNARLAREAADKLIATVKAGLLKSVK